MASCHYQDYQKPHPVVHKFTTISALLFLVILGMIAYYFLEDWRWV
ncbi:MAG: hypothetical protein RB292_02015 [Patescibacteria group bacterium]|jgi:hypothetical protein|nr:hypothetical protein [Patescibacteria group bacterium]